MEKMDSMRDKTETQDETDALSAHREQMLLPLSIVGVCCFLPFFIYHLATKNYLMSAAILALTLLFFFNGYAIYRQRKIPIRYEILLIPAAVTIVLSIINQGVFGTYWCYPLLLFFYFVLSRRMANLCGVLLLVFITIIVLQYIGRDVTIRFAVSLGALIVMANIIVGTIDDLHRQLLEQTIRDPLTGAFNRRYMESRLSDAVAQKHRQTTIASVLLFDIDFFKRINDEAGHAAGDEVLKGLVKLINGRVRQADKLFRIGGEEFLMFLPDTNEDNAATLAEHLRVLIAETPLLANRPVTVSIGVGELQAGESFEDWIKCADDALYQAKESGRNRVVRRKLNEAMENSVTS